MNRLGSSFLYVFMYAVIFLNFGAQDSYTQISRDSVSAIANKIMHWDKNLSADALVYLEENIQEIEDSFSLEYVAWVIEHMAIGYQDFGFLDEAENYVIKAISLIENSTDSLIVRNKVRLQVRLGILLKLQGFYEDAERNYIISLKEATRPDDSLYLINNLGNLYRETARYTQAVNTYTSGFDLLPKAQGNKQRHRANLLSNLGFAKSKMDSLKGLPELEEALALRLELADSEKLFSSYNQLAQYYLGISSNNRALEYAQKANIIANSIADISYKRQALKLLLDLNKTEYYPEYSRITDSLFDTEKSVKVRFAYKLYDKSKSDQRALESEQQALLSDFEATKQKAQKQRLIFAVILLFIIAAGTLIVLQNRSKIKRRKAVVFTESRIAQQVHDEVANDLFMTMSKVDLEIASKEQILDDLEQLYNKTRDISKANNPVELDRPYNEILTDLISSFKTTQLQIITKNLSAINWQRIANKKKQALYKVLQELLTNTKRYSGASIVLIEFNFNSAKLSVRYKDNGVGTHLNSKSGLAHAENRIEALAGTITFESSPNQGFSAQIDL